MPSDTELDSSFEFVNETDNIENTAMSSFSEDVVSESFEFINGQMMEEKLKIPEEKEVPITTLIIGRWKLTSSGNLSAYCESERLPELTALSWRCGDVCYEFKDNRLQSYTILNDEILNKGTIEIGVSGNVESRVENNCLKTICLSEHAPDKGWIVERRVVDGILIIVNKNSSVFCTRVYQRVL